MRLTFSAPHLTRSMLLASAMAMILTGCQTVRNPATGQNQTTTMSPQQESQIGAQEHPKIVKSYGGVVSDPRISGYVAQIGARLAANSEMPQAQWTFTVLDSPVVNAFALPGGYVYITRGLMALANDEAELAGVLGHEIGHVTGRHSAQRQTRAQQAQIVGLLATIGAAVAGVPNAGQIGQLAQTAGAGYVANFSREQELEADQLGVRYLARAGYDPFAQADFLSHMQAQSELAAAMAGKNYNPNQVDFFSTHPATAQRVRDAIGAAQRSGLAINNNAPRNRESYLGVIDGMVYGDTAEQGFVRGRDFFHPALGFAFTVPEGFTMANTAQAVQATGPNGAKIIFDGANSRANPGQHIQSEWLPAIAKQTKVQLTERVEEFDANGFVAATALAQVQTNSGVANARLIAIRTDKMIYRFTALYPPQMERALRTELQRMSYSFRNLSRGEAANLRPYTVDVTQVRRGDTVRSLVGRSGQNDEFAERRFRVMNGLDAREEPQVGTMVKLIRE